MSKEIDKLNEEIQKDLELDRRKKAVQEKDLTLREHRVTRDLDELNKNKAELEQAKNFDYGKMSKEDVDRLVRENDEYMAAAKKAMIFINKEFKKIVPYFMRNLIIMGADTGFGKSTACANAIFAAITRKNPATNRTGKVLLLTNE